MKISRLFAVASAAAFIAAASVAPAYGAPKADEKNKATLKKENLQLNKIGWIFKGYTAGG